MLGFWRDPEVFNIPTAPSARDATAQTKITALRRGAHLHLYTPRFPEDTTLATAPFPAGDISLLEGIAPHRYPFHPAAAHGPQGATNKVRLLGHWYQRDVFCSSELRPTKQPINRDELQ